MMILDGPFDDVDFSNKHLNRRTHTGRFGAGATTTRNRSGSDFQGFGNDAEAALESLGGGFHVGGP